MDEWFPPKRCHEAVYPLDFLPPEAAAVYRNSNNMALLEPSSSLFTPAAFQGEWQSQDVIVVGDEKSSSYVLIGAVTAFRSLTYFLLRKSGRLQEILMRQPHIAPGEKPEKTIVLKGSDWRVLLREYARAAAAEMGVRPVSADRNLTGYCSWYYYYAHVSEQDFLENLAAADGLPADSFSPEIFQIDDGYQTFQGDWLEQNALWPVPLREVTAKIRARGKTAGIWLMPMLASTASRTFREHPDWFVKTTSGTPLIFAGWSPEPDNHWVSLDATIPAVREHIRHFMTSLWETGFRYFKMDGLAFGLPDGVFADASATPVSAFRLAMKTIREAVPDAVLLGCGAPCMACLGYIDLCRVSNDTSRCWNGAAPETMRLQNSDNQDVGIRSAWHGTCANFWKSDIWFRADPDIVMARADNAFYTIGEARISAAAAILTGIALTSDHFGRIGPDRLAILERAAKFRLRHAMPQQWRPDQWPHIFTGECGGRKAALLVNDTPSEIRYVFSEYGLPEELDEVLIGLGRVRSELILPAHDAAFLTTPHV